MWAQRLGYDLLKPVTKDGWYTHGSNEGFKCLY